MDELAAGDRVRVAPRSSATRQHSELLLRIIAGVTEVATVDRVAEVIVDELAAGLEASGVVIWMLDDGGATASLLRARGYPVSAIERFARLTVDGAPPLPPPPLPPLEAMRTGAPVWLATPGELIARYPELATTSGRRDVAIACLPIAVQARVIGALGVTLGAALDDEVRGLLALVAGYAGQALERARLLAADRGVRARAELLYGLVAQVNQATSEAAVYDAALDAIERGLGTPRAAVLAYDDAGVMQFVAWRGLSDRYRAAVTGHSPWPRDAIAPEPVIVEDVTTAPGLEAYQALFVDERIGALGFFPLVADGELAGKFMVYYPQPRTLAAEDLELARAIANHVAAGVARFSVARARDRVVDQLERTLHFSQLFSGVLGHDLRNPLGAMMTGTQLALMRCQDDRVAQPLRKVVASGERMGRMIDQLLDFTRARVGGGITLHRGPTELEAIARNAIEEVAHDARDRPIVLERAGDLRGAWDADRLAQVFSNLVSNAVHHGAAEPVLFGLDGRGSEAVRISISNAGTIAPDVLPVVFQPFRGSVRKHDGSLGMGLGLYITQQIVQAHGGTIDVRSGDGRTTFTIDLPRR